MPDFSSESSLIPNPCGGLGFITGFLRFFFLLVVLRLFRNPRAQHLGGGGDFIDGFVLISCGCFGSRRDGRGEEGKGGGKG